MDNLFANSCTFIEEEYRRLGHTMGYRFLLCPKTLLAQSTQIYFLGLNPGGNEVVKEHPQTSCETGTAFFTEQWKGNQPGNAPLQKQVQALFDTVRKTMGVTGTARDFADKHILSAYFIPFRSPNLASLHNKDSSLLSANKLWNNIFLQCMPSYILTLGKDVYNRVCDLLQQQGAVHTTKKDIPSGWGNYNLSVSHFKNGNKNIHVGCLLHLSTFKIFGKKECSSGIELFMNELFSNTNDR